MATKKIAIALLGTTLGVAADYNATELQCLMFQGDGCFNILSEKLCVNSRDGNAYRKTAGGVGQPCAWVNGLFCERVDEAKAYVADASQYKVATCKAGQTLSDTISTVAPPAREPTRKDNGAGVAREAQMPWNNAKLSPMDGGKDRVCRGVVPGDTGSNGLFNIWTAETLDQCKELCTTECYGVEYLAETKYCEVWYEPVMFSSAKTGFECWSKPNKDVLHQFDTIRPKDMSCLAPVAKGCSSIQERFACLSSRDDSDTKEFYGLKVKGEPCVWCGGGRCHSSSASLCEPFDFLLRGEKKDFAFDVFHASSAFEVSACQNGIVTPRSQIVANLTQPSFPIPRPAEAKISCLKPEAKGCKAITDKLNCISSKDGSSETSFGGLLIQGEPCVWCGGLQCTSNNDAKCAPYHYLANGVGRAFYTFNAADLQVAQCSASSDQLGDLSCLQTYPDGCNAIKDEKTCTQSVDGRPYETVAGFKAKGQPCVWCGGGQCHSESANVCEPYDYAINGEGRAFNTRFNLGTFKRAACQAGNSVPLLVPTTLQLDGSSLTVDCGYPNPIWSKAGQTCGFCQVLVPRIKDKYATCDEYCADQGGLSCSQAYRGQWGHCIDPSSSGALGCSASFQSGEHAVCECKPRKVTTKDLPLTAFLSRPSEASTTCLQSAVNGCRSFHDRINCLSHKDGSGSITMKTFKVDGEPCVWCGGAHCTSDSDAQCEPFDWLANGLGVAYESQSWASSLMSVASCKEPSRAFENTACLKRQENGCNSIKDQSTCLSSLDGRPYEFVAGLKVSGQPCVWCGGGQCNSNNENLCEPYEFAVHGTGHAFQTNFASGTYYLAACEDGKPVSHLVPTALAKEGLVQAVDCGFPNPLWSKVGKSCGFCKVQLAAEAVPGTFTTCNDYCKAQQGGLSCRKAWTGFLGSCDSKAEVSCDTNFAAKDVPICQCDLPLVRAEAVSKPRPAEAEMTCLKPQTSGCRAIRDRINCLSSKDGSSTVEDHDLKIQGEPCVWCGDGLCSTNSNSLCEPYDWLINGQSRVFVTGHFSANYQVATCKANADATFTNLACLSTAVNGCNNLQDEQSCLSNVDGRPYEYVAGFKARGQPCVWCGGGPCHSGSANRCEPYDYAVNGKGHAFITFDAIGLYKVAACEDGKVAMHQLNHGFSEHGTSLAVECGNGVPNVWTKVSRICGQCKVHIPKIKEFYSSCNDYCAHQIGAPECVSASLPHFDSCDVSTAQTCDHVFESQEDALCECAKPPEIKLLTSPSLSPQNLYAQCGGKDWKGLTLCEAGAVCNVVNEYYAQCVPIGEAKPGVQVTKDQTLASLYTGSAKSVSALCSASPGCAKLGLSGNCCPADSGSNLECCSASGEVAATSVVIPGGPPAGLGGSVAAVTPSRPQGPVNLPTPIPPLSRDVVIATPVPVWKKQLPSEAALECLVQKESRTCGSIKDRLTCLSSKDGRTGYTSHGYRVGGEPCVWCGGVQCTSNSAALCEPYDWLVNGEGKAFSTFIARANYEIAHCQVPAATEVVVSNIGKDCWTSCNQKSGFCAWCGAGNACCRSGFSDSPNECQNVATTSWHHECVVPSRTAAIDIGIKAETDAQKAGKTPQEGITAAADAAAKVAQEAHFNDNQRDNEIADAVAAATATAGALPAVAAATAADEARSASKKGGETVLDQATDATEAAARASEDVAIATKLPSALVESTAVAAASSAGIAAGMTIGQANAAATKAVDSTIAGAKEGFASLTLNPAVRDLPTPKPIELPGLVRKPSTAEVGLDITAEDNGDHKHSVHLSGKTLKNHYADCWVPCGKKAGFCDNFCGEGNACCRETGDIIVPTECKDIYTFSTPHYECVVPKAANVPKESLLIKKRDVPTAGLDIEKEDNVITDAGATKTLVGEASSVNSFGPGQWAVVGCAAAAVLAAMCLGYALSGEDVKTKRQIKRSSEIAGAAMTAEDLEVQAGLVANAAPVPGVAYQYAQYQATPGMVMGGQYVTTQKYAYAAAPAEPSVGTSAYQQLMGTAFAQQAMAQFEQLDVNHNQRLERGEWNQAQQGSIVGAVGGYSGASASAQVQEGAIVSGYSAAPAGYSVASAPVQVQQGAIFGGYAVGQTGYSVASAPVQVTSVARGPLDLFDMMDRNHDGVISRTEMSQAQQVGLFPQ